MENCPTRPLYVKDFSLEAPVITSKLGDDFFLNNKSVGVTKNIMYLLFCCSSCR